MPQSRATMKYVRTSPRKMRRVVDLIRGEHVQEARRILRFSGLGASNDIEKLLNSAIANAEHELISLGKAGRARWQRKRPSVRGVAMNPVDHPLGGGEGKSSGGRHPTSPWGKKEGRTRKKKKASTKYIVRRRGKGRN